MTKLLPILFMSILLSAEMEVDGNLKVTGTVDASGNPITNVGAPLLSTDAASAGYVLTAAAGRGRIITLKCPWQTYINSWSGGNIGSCEPPECPEGWDSLTTFNEVVGVAGGGGVQLAGNFIRYCMEQEE